MEAVQDYMAALKELDWFRYNESKHVFGTKAGIVISARCYQKLTEAQRIKLAEIALRLRRFR